jgi:hypothetical protein
MAALVSNLNGAHVRIKLYKNNLTPTTATVLGDLVECDFAGYVNQEMTGWSVTGVSGHVVSVAADSKTFTRTSTGAAQSVYGYYVTDLASALLLWCERDSLAPRDLIAAGDTYTVVPAMTDQDLST